MNFPDFNKRFQLHTDASDVGISAILTKEKKVIRFFSSKLNETQKTYSTPEKEALAILKGCLAFKPIIFGGEIEVYTDSLNLCHEFSLAKSKLQNGS